MVTWQAALTGDPRRPAEVKAYDHRNEQDDDPTTELTVLLGVLLGMAAIITRVSTTKSSSCAG